MIHVKTQPYSIRRSRRAKNLILHVSEKGEVEVVIPWRAAAREAEKFVTEKTDWLAAAIAQAKLRERQQVRRRLVSGEKVPLLGKAYRLRVVVDPWRKKSSFGESGREVSLFVGGEGDVRRVLTRWYKKRAQKYFEEQVRELTGELGVEAKKVVISRARSQWGSCMPATGRISLNWRLTLGPPAVARYVAAHEVAHLKERKHTPAFWRLVERLDNNFESHRRWLKENGHNLRI